MRYWGSPRVEAEGRMARSEQLAALLPRASKVSWILALAKIRSNAGSPVFQQSPSPAKTEAQNTLHCEASRWTLVQFKRFSRVNWPTSKPVAQKMPHAMATTMFPDHRVGKLLLVCAALFVLATALKLNGSSVAIWNRFPVLRPLEGNGLLLSTPKPSRSDEYLVWTPGAISQCRQPLPFPSENLSLGAGKVPLMYSMPVRHYTMIFRPQLWGFFLLDIEHAFAWYWNAKIFGLFAAMFLLCHVLTRNFWLSVFGSLWLLLSSYVQWWFSCPPMLPELLSNWSLAVISAIMLFRATRQKTRLLASATFVFALMGFALCVYPPFQLLMLYLGIAVVVGFLWDENRRPLEQPSKAWISTGWLIGGLIVSGLILLPFIMECWSTFKLIAGTDYPGHRRTYGGALSWHDLFSGMLNFFISDTNFPEKYDGVSPSANFYPFWVVALTPAGWLIWKKAPSTVLQFHLLGCIGLFALFAVCPLPHWFCDATLLTITTEERCLLPIGLAGILFSLLVLNDLATLAYKPPRGFLVFAGTASAVLVAGYLFALRGVHPKFLADNLWPLMSLNIAVSVGVFTLPRRLFYLGFVALFAMSNALVNPVMAGLEPLLKSPVSAAIQQIRQRDPQAGWVAYGNSFFSQLLIANGVQTLSGGKIVPDLEFDELIDPQGQHRRAYNRYAFAAFKMPQDRDSVSIRYTNLSTFTVVIHPTHPAVRRRGVRYALFGDSIEDPQAQSLELVVASPENHFWIYRIPRDAAPNSLAQTNTE